MTSHWCVRVAGISSSSSPLSRIQRTRPNTGSFNKGIVSDLTTNERTNDKINNDQQDSEVTTQTHYFYNTRNAAIVCTRHARAVSTTQLHRASSAHPDDLSDDRDTKRKHIVSSVKSPLSTTSPRKRVVPKKSNLRLLTGTSRGRGTRTRADTSRTSPDALALVHTSAGFLSSRGRRFDESKKDGKEKALPKGSILLRNNPFIKELKAWPTSCPPALRSNSPPSPGLCARFLQHERVRTLPGASEHDGVSSPALPPKETQLQHPAFLTVNDGKPNNRINSGTRDVLHSVHGEAWRVSVQGHLPRSSSHLWTGTRRGRARRRMRESPWLEEQLRSWCFVACNNRLSAGSSLNIDTTTQRVSAGSYVSVSSNVRWADGFGVEAVRERRAKDGSERGGLLKSAKDKRDASKEAEKNKNKEESERTKKETREGEGE
ncbi:hypothetical protein BD410DRAFT_844366 [Rickenella mellea]|uniref:Uncharacterized protein n=1 Tax=Rickenella mellea TaxID=50990 RepID=A0A4Y7PM21_9AGAM|nr:hypothetical protein BD410DRAFT_844366 [Rickenella mellea]